MTSSHPLVGCVCNHRIIAGRPRQMADESYLNAVREGVGALPLLIPALDPPIPVEYVLEAVDGLIFTGSASNVAPHRYGGPIPRKDTLLDERRDATTLPLLKAAIAAGKPVLCVCRGFQELNVALGGTLHQHVHEVKGRFDHRELSHASPDVQFGPAHPVTVNEGGLLARIVPRRGFSVNSLHSQGIDKLAPALFADAEALDGQIEAVSMPGAKGFVLGLQWHPEWRWAESEISRAIFTAFAASTGKINE